MTVTDERPATEVGSPRRRKEDARLITGRTRWTDNLQLPGMLHLAMVRSPHAHARIVSVDAAAARAATNVVAVLTGEDVKDIQGGLPCAWPITPDQKAPNHPSIAVDRVAFAGEIVAVVIARSPGEARVSLPGCRAAAARGRYCPRCPPACVSQCNRGLRWLKIVDSGAGRLSLGKA